MRKATRQTLEREYILLGDQSDSGAKTIEALLREETQRIDRMKEIHALLRA
jgi:hypothetical protein